MIEIEEQAWKQMVEHACGTYPEECCGAMIGTMDSSGRKVITRSLALENASEGEKRTHYVLRPEDIVRAQKQANREGLDVLGFYHSHPDCDAYFSETDRKNSYWYSFLVLSIRNGQFSHANCYMPNTEESDFEIEELHLQ